MPDNNLSLEEILDNLKKYFKEPSKEAGEELKQWGFLMLEIKKELLSAKTDKDKENILRTEKYAWRAIDSLKAKYANQLEDITWDNLEKFLKILRNVLLNSAI